MDSVHLHGRALSSRPGVVTRRLAFPAAHSLRLQLLRRHEQREEGECRSCAVTVSQQQDRRGGGRPGWLAGVVGGRVGCAMFLDRHFTDADTALKHNRGIFDYAALRSAEVYFLQQNNFRVKA